VILDFSSSQALLIYKDESHIREDEVVTQYFVCAVHTLAIRKERLELMSNDGRINFGCVAKNAIYQTHTLSGIILSVIKKV